SDPDASPVREPQRTGPKSPPGERREAGVPRRGTQGASEAPGVSETRRPGASQAPVRLSALRHPLRFGVAKPKFQTPGAKTRRGNEGVLSEWCITQSAVVVLSRWPRLTPPARGALSPRLKRVHARLRRAMGERSGERGGVRGRLVRVPLTQSILWRTSRRPLPASGARARAAPALARHEMSASGGSLCPGCYLQ